MCTYICTAFTFLPPFPATTPSPLVPMLPTEQGVFHPPVFRFCRRENIKRKTWHFCLLERKVAIQRVSLWYFHVYMHHNPNWFIFSNYLQSALVPFL
jgi:hypothetical protein